MKYTQCEKYFGNGHGCEIRLTFILFMYINNMDGVKRFSSGTLSLNWDPKGVLKAINLSAMSPVAFRGHLNHLFGMGPGSLWDIMT